MSASHERTASVERRRLARVVAVAAAVVAWPVLVLAAPASAGVNGPAFYVDGTVYRTVGTPTDLSGTGAPAQAWDTIYDFGGAQLNVATAAPGDADYDGGRWQVHALSFPSGYDAAFAAGAAVDTGVVKQFECPVIRVPSS